MNEIRKLTLTEEVGYLKRINPRRDFIGNGSSRAVFNLNDGYCLKVAYGRGGFKQNIREALLYEDYGDEGYLAEIIAYSKGMVVMEMVEVVEVMEDEMEEEMEEWFYSEYDLDSLIDSMSQYNGHTIDNYQVGITEDYRLVSYDYGYDSDLPFWDQVGDLSDEREEDLCLEFEKILAHKRRLLKVLTMTGSKLFKLNKPKSKTLKLVQP